MTPEEFMTLVAEMRGAQATYFNFRGKDNLQRAKELEKQVDNEIRRVKMGPPKPVEKTLDLFHGDGC